MKRAVAWTVSAALLLCLLMSTAPASTANADNTYFSAVNNEEVRLPQDRYKPQSGSGKLYVPHTLLEDADIGAAVNWQERLGYLTVSHQGRSVTYEYGGKAFNTSTMETYDAEWYRMPSPGGGILHYMEIEFLCDFFGWTYSNIPTDWGRVIRLKTRDGLRSDSFYAVQVRQQLNRHFDPATPTPLPTVTPTDPSRTPAPTPTPTPEPTPIPDPLRVYITFDGAPEDAFSAGGPVSGILDTLAAKRRRAAFFLTESALQNGDPALLRRLAATQAVGLCGDADDLSDPEQWLEQATRMNGALDAVTFTRTRLTRWPALYALSGRDAAGRSEPVREALTGGGYCLWDWTLDATGQSRRDAAGLAGWIIRSLPAEGPVVLRLTPDERTAQALPLLLDELGDPSRYFLREVSLIDRPINRYGDTR